MFATFAVTMFAVLAPVAIYASALVVQWVE
jgi:hypothetical protein